MTAGNRPADIDQFSLSSLAKTDQSPKAVNQSLEETDQMSASTLSKADGIIELDYPIDTLADQLAALGRLLAAESLDLTAARTALLGGVVRALPEMSWASLTFAAGGKRQPVTLAASAELALAVDAIQYGTGAGPCLQAVHEATTVHAEDLTRERRWQPFVAAALAETPVRAVVSSSLADGGHPTVSLNLYAAEPLTVDRAGRDALAAAAAACSVAMSAIEQRHRADHLERALASGRRIGAAIGILMVSMKLTEPQAFDALRVASQHSHRKLRDVAEDVLLTGELPSGSQGSWRALTPRPGETGQQRPGTILN